jgi:hypothetical protein
LVDSNISVVSNHLSHFVGSVGVTCYSSNEITVSSCYFFAIGQVSRAGDVAGIDGITNNYN